MRDLDIAATATGYRFDAQHTKGNTMSLKTQLTAALAGTTSQNPIDTATLAKGYQRRPVEAELMRMHSKREAGSCKIIKGGTESVVWWLVGCPPPTPAKLLSKRPKAKRAAVGTEV